jgi:hypothetical protein
MVTDTEPDTRPTTRRAPRERASDAAIIARSLREPERFAQVFDRYYAEVKDATIDPLKAGNSTGKVQKGHTVVAVRLAAGVVDRPGERP